MGKRFIPAYAGNSQLRRNYSRKRPVHPRLRGELSALTFTVVTPSGSSPLTRGTLWLPFGERRPLRFIPAYAGNSAAFHFSGSLYLVHPRLRGELSTATAETIMSDGSSPLTRGTQQILFMEFSRCRFIPAYAGNSYAI